MPILNMLHTTDTYCGILALTANLSMYTSMLLLVDIVTYKCISESKKIYIYKYIYRIPLIKFSY